MEKTILVVTADTRELRKLRTLLTREGYNILTATDELTAKQLCRSIPIDFILSESSAFGSDGPPRDEH